MAICRALRQGSDDQIRQRRAWGGLIGCSRTGVYGLRRFRPWGFDLRLDVLNLELPAMIVVISSALRLKDPGPLAGANVKRVSSVFMGT